MLKGALLFALWYGQPHRPTRDADLLGFGTDDGGLPEPDLLLQDDAVDDDELRRAIAATFERRHSPLPADLPVGLSDAFGADVGKRTQWAAFLRKNRLDATTGRFPVGYLLTH